MNPVTCFFILLRDSFFRVWTTGQVQSWTRDGDGGGDVDGVGDEVGDEDEDEQGMTKSYLFDHS